MKIKFDVVIKRKKVQRVDEGVCLLKIAEGLSDAVKERSELAEYVEALNAVSNEHLDGEVMFFISQDDKISHKSVNGKPVDMLLGRKLSIIETMSLKKWIEIAMRKIEQNKVCIALGDKLNKIVKAKIVQTNRVNCIMSVDDKIISVDKQNFFEGDILLAGKEYLMMCYDDNGNVVLSRNCALFIQTMLMMYFEEFIDCNSNFLYRKSSGRIYVLLNCKQSKGSSIIGKDAKKLNDIRNEFGRKKVYFIFKSSSQAIDLMQLFSVSLTDIKQYFFAFIHKNKFFIFTDKKIFLAKLMNSRNTIEEIKENAGLFVFVSEINRYSTIAAMMADCVDIEQDRLENLMRDLYDIDRVKNLNLERLENEYGVLKHVATQFMYHIFSFYLHDYNSDELSYMISNNMSVEDCVR